MPKTLVEFQTVKSGRPRPTRGIRKIAISINITLYVRNDAIKDEPLFSSLNRHFQAKVSDSVNSLQFQKVSSDLHKIWQTYTGHERVFVHCREFVPSCSGRSDERLHVTSGANGH